ncbi:MAG: transcriptional regulator of arginine metabolism [Elusimicrobia bacterium]|nr:MAG: transcriptional regulator of arginine metabolism [Elusimicrobiota bacterium]KAF0153894.1 MAG: transcriptional regulator of arginine metabolism [Elusimicrobiota bacterium]
MNKTERIYEIRRIISAGAVGSQEALRRELARRGCKATQATLSRDLKDLGAAWMPGPGGGRYTLSSPGSLPPPRTLTGTGVTDILANENLVLVRTLPGAAASVAEFLDAQRLPGVLGTVAGDNTVLVIPGSVKKTASLPALLRRRLMAG